jgi:hypothetical protein
MKGFSYKYKIYALVAAVIVAVLIFFLFVYGWMDGRNETVAAAVAAKNQEYAEVQAEEQSYELGKKDLVTLQSKPFQPADLFSQDTKVVKEIKTLETLAGTLGVRFSLNVSGTIKDAPKLPGVSSTLYTVPYTVTLEGPFDKIVNFIETTEHLNFVTQTKALSLGASEGGGTQATLTSEFFIKP